MKYLFFRGIYCLEHAVVNTRHSIRNQKAIAQPYYRTSSISVAWRQATQESRAGPLILPFFSSSCHLHLIRSTILSNPLLFPNFHSPPPCWLLPPLYCLNAAFRDQVHHSGPSLISRPLNRFLNSGQDFSKPSRFTLTLHLQILKCREHCRAYALFSNRLYFSGKSCAACSFDCRVCTL